MDIKKIYNIYYNVVNLQLVIINNFKHYYVHNYTLILIDLIQTLETS